MQYARSSFLLLALVTVFVFFAAFTSDRPQPPLSSFLLFASGSRTSATATNTPTANTTTTTTNTKEELNITAEALEKRTRLKTRIVSSEKSVSETIVSEDDQLDETTDSYNRRDSHNTIKFAAVFSNFTTQSMLAGRLERPHTVEQSSQVLESIFWFGTSSTVTYEQLYQNEYEFMIMSEDERNRTYGITGFEYKSVVDNPTASFVEAPEGPYNYSGPFVVTFRFSKVFHYYNLRGSLDPLLNPVGPTFDATRNIIGTTLFNSTETIQHAATWTRTYAKLATNCYVLAARFEHNDTGYGGDDTALPIIYNKLVNETSRTQIFEQLLGCFDIIVTTDVSLFEFPSYAEYAAQRQLEYNHHKIGFMVALILILIVFGLAFWLGHVFTLDRREIMQRDIKSNSEGTWTTSSSSASTSKSSRSSASSRASSSSSLSSSAPPRKLTAPRKTSIVPNMSHLTRQDVPDKDSRWSE